MLEWLTGAPRSTDSAHHLETVGEGHMHLELPETPAPVFAIRAFKTAIFGTPQDIEKTVTQTLPDAKVNLNAPEALSFTNVRSTNVSDAPRQRTSSKEDQALASQTEWLEPQYSPTKPAGILLTPGTAGNRRKTVSFGASVVDNEGRKPAHGGQIGLPDNCPGKFPSPWDRSAGSQETQARTRLTKTLFDVRDADPKVLSGHPKAAGASGGTHETMKTEYAQPGSTVNSKENDLEPTLDLNDPHSRSGRYWKSEYSSYQDKTNEEMKRLVKYKKMAKSYAKKKDSEAMDLGEKLREEREKVNYMEGQIQELAGQIAAVRRSGDSKGPDQVQLMKELARQTALALEYKGKVDDFQAALEGRTPSSNHDHDRKARNYTSPRTEKTLVQTSVELKKAREQLHEMKTLRVEIDVQRNKLEEAETKSLKLEEERAVLQKSLARVKEEMRRYEQRREDKERQRDEKLGTERSRHKERLTEMKLEHQKLLHDSETAWNEERARLRDEIATMSAVAKGHGSPLREKLDLDLKPVDSHRSEWQQQQRKILQELRQAREESSSLRIENEHLKIELRDAQAANPNHRNQPQPPKSSLLDESLLDIWTQPEVKDGTQLSPAPAEGLRKQNPGSKAAHAERLSASFALDNRNLNVNAGLDTMLKQSPRRRSLSPEKRSKEACCHKSPSHPSPHRPPITTKVVGVNFLDNEHVPYRTDNSPRPSMFSMASSPPVMRPLSMPLNTATMHSRHDAAAKGGNAGIRRTVSSRVGSLASASGRPNLPPDRVAAAKARLEQKNAEKRLMKHSGKENEGVQLE
ncbi:MAG: hypothetical protein M1812_002250 [Candelaria pacifica]|nr:MAG: hypothetical protein M1812_002250 [Candelaria pacifica]